MASVARRYASALMQQSASDLSKSKAMLESLQVLSGLFENAESRRVLQSPVMPIDLKKNLLSYGLQQGQAPVELKALIEIMTEAGRVGLIPEVIKAYELFLDEMQGKVKADVVTAIELNETEKQSVIKELSTLIKKKVEIETTVDPAILGGFVANIGNYRIDLSLRSKLEGLSQNAVQDTIG